MPTFDLVLLLQKLDMSALKSALKRNAQYIFQVGGIIREMENLGFRDLPYKISQGGKPHRNGHFFVIKYDASFEMRNKLKEQFKLDRDVLRACNFQVASNPQQLHTPKKKTECTLYEDELPPPFRPAIVKVHERFKRKQKEKESRNKYPLKNLEDKKFLIF